MPLFLGMGLGVNWNVDAAVTMLPSLAGHMMYGAILGTVFALRVGLAPDLLSGRWGIRQRTKRKRARRTAATLLGKPVVNPKQLQPIKERP